MDITSEDEPEPEAEAEPYEDEEPEEEPSPKRAGAGGGGHPHRDPRHPPERQRLPAAGPVRALARRRLRLARPDPPLRAARRRRGHRPRAPAAALGALPVARARRHRQRRVARAARRAARASRTSRRCSRPSACRCPRGSTGCPTGAARGWRSPGPPGAGATGLLRRIVGALREHQPDLPLTVVLAGVRPEEVTEWRRDAGVTVAGGAFDRSVEEQAQVAEMAVERAKRIRRAGRPRGRAPSTASTRCPRRWPVASSARRAASRRAARSR